MRRLLPLVLVLGGCSSMFQGPLDPEKQQKLLGQRGATSTTTKVAVEGNGLAIGEQQQVALSPAALENRVSELLPAKRLASAQMLIRRYPDVALDILRDATNAAARQPSIQAIALTHDAQCLPGAAEGWRALLQDRIEHPDRFARFDATREQFLAYLRNGEPDSALASRLSTHLPNPAPPLLRVETARLAGMAYLLADKPREAASAFRDGFQAARDVEPYQAVQLQLLLSECLRRSGDKVAATAAWQQAVETAAEFRHVHDPVLWERAAYLRPVDASWPARCRSRLHAWSCEVLGLKATAEATESDETTLLTCVGHWRLEREEADAALVALKRAESLATGASVRERLQLAEAQALMQLQQMTAASTLLISLAANKDSASSRPATALLGTLKLREGQTTQGLNLLRSALGKDGTRPDSEWPGRMLAEADLGLAYLLVGDERNGLAHLQPAQQQFEAAGHTGHLLASLQNELEFHEQAKHKDQARQIRVRLAELEEADEIPLAKQ